MTPLFAHIPEAQKGLLEPFLLEFVPWLYADSMIWTIIGLAGAGIFSSRFFFQWLHSEKAKRLVVPTYFWHLSFWGSTLNFVYALHIDKLPIILGCCFLPVLYGRNLILLRRSQREIQRAELDGGDGEDGNGKG